MNHGTTTAYQHHKCRCDLCRGAWRDYLLAWRGIVVTVHVPVIAGTDWADEWARKS